jgi:NitT/TauT family transport system permease protein
MNKPRRLVIRRPISNTAKIILGVVSILILFALYELLSYRQHTINPADTTIPSLTQMWASFKKACAPDTLGHVWLLDDSRATLTRFFLGLGVGVFLSVIIGTAMGCFLSVEAFCLPTLSFFAKIPPTAMLAVFFVLVGMNLTMFMTMIGFGVLPTLTQAIYQSAKYDVQEELINKAYTLGASNTEVILSVIFRQILPRIIEAVRLQVGPAMVFLIAAEWMLADVGFGYRLRIQSRLMNMGVVYVYIILLGAFGFCVDRMLTKLRQWTCPWFDNMK